MKIGLIGTGKMGKGLIELATDYECTVVATINSQKQDWSKMLLADIWLDFSSAKQVPLHVEKAISSHKNLLIGTTNWEDALPSIQKQVCSSSIGVLALPNASMGLFIFMEVLKKASVLLSNSSLNFETKGLEIHHEKKLDAPSGTAKEISKTLSLFLNHSINFECKRTGNHPGYHEISFSTPFETITFSHEAKNREGFLRGALQALFWLRDKSGFFTMHDYLKEVFCET